MKANRRRYLMSLADELTTQSDRVRNLIGDAHWYTDGHHKEYLLTGLLNRHLPQSMIAARGFVLSPDQPDVRSKEQDVLIVDTHTEGPVFSEGGVVMAFPHTVVAAISVKTRMGSAEVGDSVKGLSSVLTVAVDAVPEDWHIWTGAFFFDGSPLSRNPALFYDHYSRAAVSNPAERSAFDREERPRYAGEVFASAQNLVFAVNHSYQMAEQQTVSLIRGFECNGLSTSIFLAALLRHVARVRGSDRGVLRDWTDDGTLKPISESERVVVQPEDGA